jgi:hypothetical protein
MGGGPGGRAHLCLHHAEVVRDLREPPDGARTRVSPPFCIDCSGARAGAGRGCHGETRLRGSIRPCPANAGRRPGTPGYVAHQRDTRRQATTRTASFCRGATPAAPRTMPPATGASRPSSTERAPAPIVTTPGWFVVLVDDPDHHIQVDASDLEPGMPDGDLAAATDAAPLSITRGGKAGALLSAHSETSAPTPRYLRITKAGLGRGVATRIKSGCSTAGRAVVGVLQWERKARLPCSQPARSRNAEQEPLVASRLGLCAPTPCSHRIRRQ